MSRAKKRGGGDHDGGGGGGGHGGASGRWLVSYADFMTLMFVVFLVMFSMAQMDATKYSSLAQSLRQTLGPNVQPLPSSGAPQGAPTPVAPADGSGPAPAPDWTAPLATDQKTPPEPTPVKPQDQPAPPSAPATDTTAPTPAPEPAPKPAPADSMSGLADAFQGLPGVRSGLLKVTLDSRGLVLSIAGSVLFDPGKTDLKPEARTYLDQVAGKLGSVQSPIMVQGTADSAEATKTLSSWDLAALRSGTVVRYLISGSGLPGSQFVTIGHGSDGGGGSDADRMVHVIVTRKAQN